MPIQIEGGPTAEYEQANADWDSLVTATIQAAQERDRAERLWQSGRRSEAMAILHRNPNVGIEYRALVGDEVVASGSYFGKDAADFLNGLSMAVDAGLLLPVTEQRATARHHQEVVPRQLYGSGMDFNHARNFMKGYNAALKVLDNPDCLREVSLLGRDLYYRAKNVLVMIFENRGFRFDPTLKNIAQARQGHGGASRITLSERFFEGWTGSSTRNTDHLLYGDVLAIVLLHEIVHALGGDHGAYDTEAGKKEHDRWNDVIYDNCFKKP
jgi:hypothetical protein